MKKKVGIFGGSFDPVHFGHLNLSIALKEAAGLDEVLFVPAGISPFKQHAPPRATAEHRLECLKLALEPLKNFHILDLELQSGGPSYTIDTVRTLCADPHLELHLLLGEDQLHRFFEWKDAEELVRLAPPIVGRRRGALGANGSQFKTFDIPLFDISSTHVRKRLAEKKYCGHLVPAETLKYILKHHLYV